MRNDCVLSRIEQHAAAAPFAVAVASREWSANYAEFDGLTTHWARSLAGAGVKKGDRVLILGRRIVELPCAVVGILKAGATFAIVDPSHPADRLARMAAAFAPDATIELFEPRGALADYLSTTGAIRIRDWNRERLSEFAAADPVAIPLPRWCPTPDQMAYAVFTSGTTGEPKVVGAPWGALTNFLEWQRSEFLLTPRDRFSMFSGLGYDPLVRDMLAPLWCGGTICVPPEPGIVAEDAATWAKEQQVTVLHWTPSMCDVFASGGEVLLPDLRWALFGGEPLGNRHVRSVMNFAPRARCANVYGASETPQVIACHIVEDLLASEAESFPIGRPIRSITIDVTDKHREPRPAGEWGELKATAEHLSLGYLNDVALSHRQFGPAGADCYSEYFTGDVARQRADGLLEVAGRNDRQVKLRGQRIELAEIEQTLIAVTGAPRAFAAIQGEEDQQELVGYVVGDRESIDPQSVRGALATTLPPGMVPSQIVWLRDLPLTPSGKIDTAALSANRTSGSAPPISEMSEEEEAVAQIWASMLKLDRIGPEDNFFMLGGFSMLAVRMLKRVQEKFAVSLPVSALLQSPTLAAFAGTLARLRTSRS